MWLLPWEKLPPLFTGPFLIFVNTIVILGGVRNGKGWDELVEYFVLLAFGLLITGFGWVAFLKNDK